MNDSVFIVGGGPSLKNFNFDKLTGKDIIAVNKAIFDVPNAKYFITVDYTFIGKVGKDALKNVKCKKVFVVDKSYDFIKKINGIYTDTRYNLQYIDLDIFDEIIEANKQDGFGYTVNDFSTGMNSGYCAVQYAITLGYKNIYLLGFDFRSVSKKTHYHDGYGQNAKDFDITLHKYLEKFNIGLNQLSGDEKVNVYSCSKISKLNGMIPYSEILDNNFTDPQENTYFGFYITGVGKAHKCSKLHDDVFHCRMFGTFNIMLAGLNITNFKPTLTTSVKQYWFVKITTEDDFRYGWAIRDYASRQRLNVIEVLTKKFIPDTFKTEQLKVTILNSWTSEQTKAWADDQYWFQTFPFTPKPRANSEHVWKKINRIKWSNNSVLDIGCHYGYFSFKAAEHGANVVGVDSNMTSLECAKTIRDHIIQQPILFYNKIPNNIPNYKYDIVFYLSVHHQIDPLYKKLKEQIEYLKSIAVKHIFIELIMPPMFPSDASLTEAAIDKIVGGEILDTYKHRIRGTRRIYHIKLTNEK